MLRHEENLCLFVTYFVLRVYTMLSCMLTCTQNSFCFIGTPHGSRLAANRAVEKSAAATVVTAGVYLGFQGSLNTGKATSPPPFPVHLPFGLPGISAPPPFKEPQPVPGGLHTFVRRGVLVSCKQASA